MKVIYIHARPHGHPLHDKYGRSVASETIFRDFKVRWHDIETTSIKRYWSWLVCAFSFPSKRSYDVFYSDGLVYFLIIMRKLHLIKKKQKLVALIDDETLYFLKTGRYSQTGAFLIRYTLNNYDAFVCVGNMEARLLNEVLRSPKPIKTIFNGVADSRVEKLSLIKPNPDSKKILFIGNMPTENRAYYKGLRFLLESFEKMFVTDPQLELIILGDIADVLRKKYLGGINERAQQHVSFKGNVSNIEEYLKEASFYLHCSNGESWGISVQEAMFAGVVPFVSDHTGVCQVVGQVSEKLVFETGNIADMMEKVHGYLQMSPDQKIELSEKCREVVKEYTSSSAIAHFKNAFYQLVND